MKAQTEGTQAKEIWQDVYRQKTGFNYYWSGKDAASVKQIMNKLAAQGSDDVMRDLRAYLSAAYDVGDRWVKDHYSPAVINSQFNELFRKAMNNGQQQSTNNVSRQYAEKVFRDLHE